MGLLSDIQLNENQEKEFVSKLDAWKSDEHKKIEEAVRATYEQRLAESQEMISKLKGERDRITEDGDLDFSDKESEILKRKLTEWKEKVQEETEEALGDKFLEVFRKGEEKLKKSYSEKFVKTLKDIYEEIEASVKDKLTERAEFKAFSDMKKIVAPFIVEGEYKDSIIEDVKKYKEVIAEQKKMLEDIKIKNKLDQLTKGMPSDLKEDFVSNLGEVSTEEELVEKFQKHVKLMKKVRDTVRNELKESDESAAEAEKPEGEEKPAEGEEKPAEEGAPAEATAEGEAPAEAEGDAPAEEAAAAPAEGEAEGEAEEAKPEEAPADEIKEEASGKGATGTAEEGKTDEEDIDYDILSEDMKRAEEKPQNLRRLQELAGLV